MKRSLALLSLLITLSMLLAACGTAPAQPAITAPAAEPALQATLPQPTADTASASQSSETANPPAEAVVQRPVLDTTYENALTSRLLLSFGALKLAETSTPITVEQAPQLLMLWQALSNLTKSGTGATEEVTALLTQIEQSMTPEQITAINAMKLSQTDMQTWAQANGIAMGSGSGTGTGMGQGKNLSPEARATRQAANGMTGQVPGGENGLSGAITTALIAYLQTIQ